MLQKEWQRKQKVSFYCMQLFIAVGWMWPYTENIAHSRHGTPRAGGAKSTASYDAVSLAWSILFSGNSIYTLMNVSLSVFPFSQPPCFITKEWEEFFFFFLANLKLNYYKTTAFHQYLELLPAVGLCCSLATWEIYGGSSARVPRSLFFSAWREQCICTASLHWLNSLRGTKH